MKLPAELQAMINDFLGMADPLSLLLGMHKNFAIPLDLIKKQNECWILEQFRSLFRDDKWLKHVCKDGFNPVLIGDFRSNGYVVLHLARLSVRTSERRQLRLRRGLRRGLLHVPR